MTLAAARIRRALRQTPLRAVARWSRFCVRVATDPDFRGRQARLWREYTAWRRDYGHIVAPSLRPVAASSSKTALVMSKGTANGAKIEQFLIKGLELAGYTLVVLAERDLAKFYKLAGVTQFLYWDDFSDVRDGADAHAVGTRVATLDELLAVEYAGARVGRFAVSTALRFLREGTLDLSNTRTRQVVIDHLAEGMMRAAAARRILDASRPALALCLGNRYTGHGELMDACVALGVPVLAWFEAHRGRTLMLKRYGADNIDQHHASLSDHTWRLLCSMDWTADHRRALEQEMSQAYSSGEWYSRGGTQFRTRLISRAELSRRLALDLTKKTAVIFPHIVWDATLFWGRDLFAGYEHWLVETVRAACANPQVNWIVKIHPANVVKSAWENYAGEPAEVVAIRRHIGHLPPHVKMVSAASDISTYSLFDVMDCCVTVRGTVGIEAAARGINVLTAGTGRYSGYGFTIDSSSKEEYLAKLASIHLLPPMMHNRQELAERFAFGTFVLRPWRLETLAIDYERDAEAKMMVRLNVETAEQLRAGADLNAFANWVANAVDQDFLERRVRLSEEWPRSA